MGWGCMARGCMARRCMARGCMARWCMAWGCVMHHGRSIGKQGKAKQCKQLGHLGRVVEGNLEGKGVMEDWE